MSLLFYTPHIENDLAPLDREESRHLLTVLRKDVGDQLRLTDGKGCFYNAIIAEAGKKQAVVRIVEKIQTPEPPAKLHIAIAPTKQIDRFEWFLEKATEIGIQKITPLLCQRSERKVVRHDRLEKVLISAMKQSLQSRLPQLQALTRFADVVRQNDTPQRFIAWCPNEPLPDLRTLIRPSTDTLILIGPEGDFSPEEIALADENGFTGIGLGSTRLRTETAGLVAVMRFHFA